MPLVVPTPVPPYPPAPQPTDDRVTFSTKAFSLAASYEPQRVAFNTALDQVYTNAQYAFQQANRAQEIADIALLQIGQAQGDFDGSVILAQTAINASVGQAAASALAAQASASYKGEWVALAGALNLPATVSHLGRLWYLKVNLANVASQTPAPGSAYWGEVSRNDFIVLPCPAGATNAADRGLYRMTSSASVLVLPAAPWHGMVVAAVNLSGSLTPVIQRNGKTVVGDAEDYLMNQLGWQIMLQYDAASNDWVRISGITAYMASLPAIGSANIWTALQNFTGGLAINGIPVIESGSNANGSFTKFADGTLHMTAVAALNMTNLAGLTQTFPAAFVGDRPWVGFCGIAAQAGQENLRNCSCLSGSSNWLIRTEVTVAGVTAYPIKLMAIGRWY